MSDMKSKQNHSNLKQLTKANGFTLVELMVSLVIGMVVLGAGVGLLKTSASQRHMINNASQLQEEAFFLSHVLQTQIAQIAYRPVISSMLGGRIMPIPDAETAFLEVPGKWSAGQAVRIDGTTLHYRYYGANDESGNPDSSVFNCLGTPIGGGVVVESQISFSENKLSCTVGSESQVIFGSDTGTTIEQLVYELGVDDTSDNIIDRYIPSSTATTDDFINTKQINLRLLLATEDNVSAGSQTYMFNGVETTATDRKMRLESEIAMEIRNF